ELARCDVEEAALGLVAPAIAASRLAAAAAAFERMGMAGDARRARSLRRAAGEPPGRVPVPA
ncbi:MAG TPA: hypothetical protein VGB08_01875, partial [Allosphingosinicella sp.]